MQGCGSPALIDQVLAGERQAAADRGRTDRQRHVRGPLASSVSLGSSNGPFATTSDASCTGLTPSRLRVLGRNASSIVWSRRSIRPEAEKVRSLVSTAIDRSTAAAPLRKGGPRDRAFDRCHLRRAALRMSKICSRRGGRSPRSAARALGERHVLRRQRRITTGARRQGVRCASGHRQCRLKNCRRPPPTWLLPIARARASADKFVAAICTFRRGVVPALSTTLPCTAPPATSRGQGLQLQRAGHEVDVSDDCGQRRSPPPAAVGRSAARPWRAHRQRSDRQPLVAE